MPGSFQGYLYFCIPTQVPSLQYMVLFVTKMARAKRWHTSLTPTVLRFATSEITLIRSKTLSPSRVPSRGVRVNSYTMHVQLCSQSGPSTSSSGRVAAVMRRCKTLAFLVNNSGRVRKGVSRKVWIIGVLCDACDVTREDSNCCEVR